MPLRGALHNCRALHAAVLVGPRISLRIHHQVGRRRRQFVPNQALGYRSIPPHGAAVNLGNGGRIRTSPQQLSVGLLPPKGCDPYAPSSYSGTPSSRSCGLGGYSSMAQNTIQNPTLFLRYTAEMKKTACGGLSQNLFSHRKMTPCAYISQKLSPWQYCCAIFFRGPHGRSPMWRRSSHSGSSRRL